MKKVLLILGVFIIASCSTTKLLPEGEFRLDENNIELGEGHSELKQELSSYIRQSPNRKNFLGLNQIGLYVYNWSNGSGKGINKFWESLGTPPVVYNSELTEDSKTNLLNRLHYLGYYNADVKTDVELDEETKLAKVKYNINIGTRKQIDSIVFEVPKGEFYEDFLKDKTNISIKEGDYLIEEKLEAETQRGASYFRNLGYYEFNKNNYFFEADTLSVENKTILYYIIRPYTRNEIPTEEESFSKFSIEHISIEYPGDVKLNKRKLLKLNPITPGMVYSEDIVNLAYNRFSSSNLFNSVNMELEPIDSTSLDCKIKLRGLDPYGVKLDAEFSTNASGLLGASPKISFYHKNIFHGGERLNLDFTGNWQYHPRTKAHSTTFGASASLLFPRALGFNTSKTREVIPRTEIKIAYNYQNRPEFERYISSFSYGYIGQFNPNFFYQIYPFQLSTTKLQNISSDFMDRLLINPYLLATFMDLFDLGVGFSLNYNSDPAIVPKSAYNSIRWSVDASGNLLSLFNKHLVYDSQEEVYKIFGLPYDQYIRSELSFTKAFRFGAEDRSAIAFRINAGIGYAYGNSEALPFEKQFYCGGANSMRAWQARTLGPGTYNDDYYDFFAIPSQTGDMKIEADLELRFPLVWKLEAALFAEAGNVWVLDQLKEKNEFIDGIATDWGLGLRVNLDFILIRLDAGFKMRDPVREAGSRWLQPKEWFGRNGYAIHFGVGYPF